MRRRGWVPLFIALLLYVPLGFLQVSIDYSRKLEDLETGLLLMPGQAAGSFILSGFRGIGADLLWLNIEEYWHSGQHYKMLPLLESIAWLQPRYVTVWAVGGWHMAYNIYAGVGSRETDLTKRLEAVKAKLSPELKGKAARLFEAADRAKGFHAAVDNEPKLMEAGALDRAMQREVEAIAPFEKEKDLAPVYEAVSGLLQIPLEKLFWYRQGVGFLRKGVAHISDKYDVYFELAWTYYHKGKDYANAVRYFERAVKHPHPDYVNDVLAHAYEKNGEIAKAIKQWEYVRDHSEGFRNIALRMLNDLRTKGKATP